MAQAKTFSIDITGFHSKLQAERMVLELREEAAAKDVRLHIMDASAMGAAYPRVLIIVECAKHHWLIAPDDVCHVCQQENPA